MTVELPHRATAYLANLRRAGPRPLSLPSELAPRSEAEAYQLQTDTMHALRAGRGAWKVAMNDAHSGTCAPIFASDLWRSGARIASPITERFGIEPEVAFTLKEALPALPEGRHYQLEQVIAAIGSAHAVIEVLISRFRSLEGAPPLDRLADNLSNGGLVIGAPCENWQQLDMRTLPLRLCVGGGSPPNASLPEVYQAQGGHPLDCPLLPLLWLANYRSDSGHGMQAGELVTTGSFAGLRYVGRGTHVSVRFEGLGDAELYS